MHNLVSQITQAVKDVLFPVFCLLCEDEGVWLCNACLASVEIVRTQYCPVCHRETKGGIRCSICAHAGFLDTHTALFVYGRQYIAEKLLHVLKYEYAEDVMQVISVIVQHACKESPSWLGSAGVIMPVPLHKKRFAERGFNQATLLARVLSESVDIPMVYGLKRGKATEQQATLSKQERMANVRGVFEVTQDVEGLNILLVDDVYTTGSTMQECARVLRVAGAKSVMGWSFARGE